MGLWSLGPLGIDVYFIEKTGERSQVQKAGQLPAGEGQGLSSLSLRLGYLGCLGSLGNRCLFHLEDAGQLLEVRLGQTAVSEACGVSLVWYWVLRDLQGLSVGLTVVSGACGVSL